LYEKLSFNILKAFLKISIKNKRKTVKLIIPDSTNTLSIPTSIMKNLFSLIKLYPTVVIRGPTPKIKSLTVSIFTYPIIDVKIDSEKYENGLKEYIE
jgi:hypothetical protein